MRCVLFDFDGTLARTAADMTAALNAMRAARGLPPLAVADAAARVSGGARALLEFGGLAAGGTDPAAARAEFLRLYEATGYEQTDLFPGAAELLHELNGAGKGGEDGTVGKDGTVERGGVGGWEWGVMTNKPRRYFAPLAEKLGWGGKAGLVAGDDCARAKPHPDGLLRAAALCGAPPERCVYAGDDPRDARAAQAAGMPFILAAWGYWTPSHWAGAAPVAALAAAPRDIPPLTRMLLPDA